MSRARRQTGPWEWKGEKYEAIRSSNPLGRCCASCEGNRAGCSSSGQRGDQGRRKSVAREDVCRSKAGGVLTAMMLWRCRCSPRIIAYIYIFPPEYYLFLDVRCGCHPDSAAHPQRKAPCQTAVKSPALASHGQSLGAAANMLRRLSICTACSIPRHLCSAPCHEAGAVGVLFTGLVAFFTHFRSHPDRHRTPVVVSPREIRHTLDVVPSSLPKHHMSCFCSCAACGV